MKKASTASERMRVPDAPPPYATVLFDCDSTLSAIEGIEELGRRAGVDISELTELAMSGEVPLEDVFGLRLERVRPGRDDLAAVGRRYVEERTRNAGALVGALAFLGKRVDLVSGGVRQAVEPLARALGIPDDRVHAVRVELDAQGRYAGFDRASPLARSGGKPELVRALDAREGIAPAALVGDGATDLEAAPALARFVAFAGHAARASVLERSRVRCERPDFAALVPLLLSPEERARLAEHPDHSALEREARRFEEEDRR